MKLNKINWVKGLDQVEWLWIEVITDFCLPIGFSNYASDLDKIKSLDLKSGDIIGVALGDYQDFDRSIRSCTWTLFNGEIQASPSLSIEFINRNSIHNNGILFCDVTLNVKRMIKLNQII